MNWIKQNPFIAGLTGITVVLLGVFGFLLMQKQSAYADLSERFISKSKEAQDLQGRKPYRDKSNLQKATEEKEKYKGKVEDLQKTLVGFNLPLEPITVVDFVSKLRDLNAKLVDAAGKDGVKLPEKFYMGFEQYETSQPAGNTTSGLNRQLDTIDTVLKLLLQHSVSEIKTLKRDPIPEEQNKESPKGLVTKTSFLLEFRTDQEKARSILDKIVAMEKPFLVIRNMRIVNDVVERIPRTPPAAAAGAAAPAPVDPAAAPADPNQENPLPQNPPSAITTVTGSEKITISLEIEVITFGEGQAQAQAPQKPAPGADKKPKR